MLNKWYFSLISMNFETEHFLKTWLPPSVSSTESKNRLKSSPRIIILFSKSSKFLALDSFFPCRNLLIFGVWIIQINQNKNAVINHRL